MINVALQNPFFNSPVLFFDELDSTMDTARHLSRQEASSGTVVVAAYQRKGRGRGDLRRWQSDAGNGLLFTLILDKRDVPVPLHRIPLLTGYGLCRYMRSLWQLSAFIKWPNDVLVDHKKLSGILCECVAERIFIGVGINCRKSAASRFEDTGIHACSLQELIGRDVSPMEILDGLLCELKDVYAAPQSVGNPELESLLYGRGSEVLVRSGPSTNKELFPAKIEGLNSEGFLLIRGPDNILKTLHCGEICYQGLF